mmetsp:Transcript_43129/g.80937  ORF Transcript_43129/g.80937 Transcript_43129/m.80937 type:complete len:452 (+) Transcript_43129:84-1439(+)
MSVNLVIKTVGANSTECSVDIDTSATVAELKEQIAGRVGMPASHIRLVCAGRIWQDATTVASYEPRAGAMVHCLNNPPRAAPAAAEQVVSESNPMQSMMQGMPSMNSNSNDPFEQMMAQSQRMLMQNPEMMQQLMNSPMVQQMMSDPETMRNMMRMDPRLNQLMEQRPEIARMLEDPEILQQSMRMAANPSLMREMQRNADLSIGRLDAMPGGHNALVRAHEEIADPLFAAMSGGNTQGGSAELNTYSHSTEGGPSSEALPNPWGAPAPAPSPAPATTPATPGMLGATQPVNPFLASMLAPGGQPAAPTAGGAGANPMATMMQQMMSNPAMMQQSMAMAQQMFGQGAGAPAAATTPASNPMATMMQQMMSSPALMQSFGGAGLTEVTEASSSPAALPAAANFQRAQFATQLAQLSAMGFVNEEACLRVLAQHQGRVDAAIDALLSSGEGTA